VPLGCALCIPEEFLGIPQGIQDRAFLDLGNLEEPGSLNQESQKSVQYRPPGTSKNVFPFRRERVFASLLLASAQNKFCYRVSKNKFKCCLDL
jgi:hypothetical protein